MKAYIIVETIDKEKDEATYLFYNRKWREDRIMNVSKVLKRGYKKTRIFGYDAYAVNL